MGKWLPDSVETVKVLQMLRALGTANFILCLA